MQGSSWSRPFRRLWRPFLSRQEKDQIVRVIAEVEEKTTGEIHVHVAGRAGSGDILELARRKFVELGLDKTRRRNGVLILVSDLDHRFAIWGDAGIDAAGGAPLWEKAKEALLSHFKERRYAEGIMACAREVGAELAKSFPKTDAGSDTNELPDQVTGS